MEVLGGTFEMPTVWHSVQEGRHLVGSRAIC